MTVTHPTAAPATSLNRLALSATLHCLTGCAIGEFSGMAIATALGWGNAPQMALAIFLAYLFGFGLTAWPLLRAGLADGLFYGSIAAGFAIAFPFAFGANRYLIARGKGHAAVHAYH